MRGAKKDDRNKVEKSDLIFRYLLISSLYLCGSRVIFRIDEKTGFIFFS